MSNRNVLPQLVKTPPAATFASERSRDCDARKNAPHVCFALCCTIIHSYIMARHRLSTRLRQCTPPTDRNTDAPVQDLAAGMREREFLRESHAPREAGRRGQFWAPARRSRLHVRPRRFTGRFRIREGCQPSASQTLTVSGQPNEPNMPSYFDTSHPMRQISAWAP